MSLKSPPLRGRRGKTDRVQKTRADGTWTEASFWGFIRSGLRSMSRRWPPRRNALTAARRHYRGENKRQKWEFLCSACEGWFKATEVQVDHIEPVGSLLSWDDVAGFAKRLFVEKEGLRVLCQKCHDKRKEEPNAEH